MITDLLIAIILLILFFFLLPLILAGMFYVFDKVFNPIWEWYMGILDDWIENRKDGEDD